MKNPRVPPLNLVAGLFLALGTALSAAALTPTEWERQQAVPVNASGVVQLDLPDSTFDAAGPQQSDLRLLDASGRETAYLLDRPPIPVARTVQPTDTAVTLREGASVVIIATGTAEKLSAVTLATPAPFFLRAAKVEISGDRTNWSVIADGTPLFRQWGAEQLQLNLGEQAAAFIRVTIADRREQPLVITGATLHILAGAAPESVPVAAEITHREEFAGETILTVSLAARHVPLSEIGFAMTSPLFMRRVQIAVREVRDAATTERVIASGTLYRVALPGSAAQESLRLPVYYTPETRELLVHIFNGDSAPLEVSTVQVARVPLHLFFFAAAPGNYQLLSGNLQATAPRYDLAGFAGELRTAQATRVIAGAALQTPGFQPAASLAAAPLPDVPLLGAPLDLAPWSQRRAVQMETPGIEQLELDLPALAGARPDYSDLRLISNGQQIPYILEQPALARSLDLTLQSVPDAARRSVSVWKIVFPQEGLPLQNLLLRSTSPLFQRHFRVYEKVRSTDSVESENILAEGDWSRTPLPGVSEIQIFPLNQRVRSSTVFLETDNGDNPPIALSNAQVTYPVVRMVFKVASPEARELVYGNASANFPRYDLDLVAARLLTPARHDAHLTAAPATTPSRNPLAALRGGYLFWAALALVVVALLGVMAKMLPKPTPPAA